MPFTYVPLWLARGLMAALGAAAFTYVITRRGKWALYFLLSGAMLWAWVDVQWAPLLMAAALTPAFSFLLAIKPTLGFALWSAYPNRWAVIGGLLFVGISLLVRPGWIPEWLASVSRTPHESNLLRPGGFLMLLGLLRWRRPEGRLLAVLCLVPQTTALYETLAAGAGGREQAAGRGVRDTHDGGAPAVSARAAGAVAGGGGVSVVGVAGAGVPAPPGPRALPTQQGRAQRAQLVGMG